MKNVNSVNFDSNMVQLLKEDESFSSEDMETMASLSVNPLVTWAKFVLTDDIPNEKKERVPKEEFDNLIKSGVFMPIKMAESAINDDHSDAAPLGVITHLKKVKNQVVGLAALWKRERQEDIQMIKEKFDKNEPINLSWEIVYGDTETSADGVTDLLDTSLRAATIVGMPAYAGRTTFTALASKEKQEEILEELEKLQKELDTLKESYSSLEDQLKEKSTELEELNPELDKLRQYKTEIEDEKEKVQKLGKIQEKFSSAKIEKGEEYFSENGEMLLGLSEDALDFMIQELVAFASTKEEDEEDGEEVHSSIPNLKNQKPEKELDPIKLAEEARKALFKTEEK